MSLSRFAIVVAVAFVPLIAGLLPRVRLPGAVLEIAAGIVIGPSLLGWVDVDLPLQVLSLIGLAFLLFPAGLEIDFDTCGEDCWAPRAGGFVVSFVLALLVTWIFAQAGVMRAPLPVAIILTATSLGVVIPLLKDAGEKPSEQQHLRARTQVHGATRHLTSIAGPSADTGPASTPPTPQRTLRQLRDVDKGSRD